MVLACVLLGTGGAAGVAGEQPPERAAPEKAAPEKAPLEEAPETAHAAADCGSGVVKDDGDPESGYGFVPAATQGIYVQKFHADEFPAAS